MAVLGHFEASGGEREAYIKMSRAVRGEGEPEEVVAEGEDEEGEQGEQGGNAAEPGTLSQERYAEMGAAEEFILTISENGYGKRTSAYEYRTTRRGGKGIVAMVVNERNGPIVASFPAEVGDQIILVTDRGQLICCGVDGIRIAGRSTQGVIVFDTADDERVVSVGRLRGLGGQRLHLGGDHGEALAGLAGARRLDGGVERQQVGLAGDVVDQLDHVADLLGGLRRDPRSGLLVASASSTDARTTPVVRVSCALISAIEDESSVGGNGRGADIGRCFVGCLDRALGALRGLLRRAQQRPSPSTAWRWRRR